MATNETPEAFKKFSIIENGVVVFQGHCHKLTINVKQDYDTIWHWHSHLQIPGKIEKEFKLSFFDNGEFTNRYKNPMNQKFTLNCDHEEHFHKSLARCWIKSWNVSYFNYSTNQYALNEIEGFFDEISYEPNVLPVLDWKIHHEVEIDDNIEITERFLAS